MEQLQRSSVVCRPFETDLLKQRKFRLVCSLVPYHVLHLSSGSADLTNPNVSVANATERHTTISRRYGRHLAMLHNINLHNMAVYCIILALTITISVSEAAECGVTVANVQRIVGGESVTVYTYPWFVAILQKNDFSEMNVVCGGSLITDKHVLTAAHCFQSQSESAGSGYRAVLKLYNRCDSSSRGENVGITKVNVSPKYKQSTMEGDIAIITLAKSVDNSPICLPQSGSNHRGGSSIWSQLWNPFKKRPGSQVTGDAIVIGFGSTKVKSRYPCYMQEASVRILSSRECRNTNLPRQFTEVPNTVCAGILAGRVDSCDGDSGGPLMTVSDKGRYTLQGITSFGEGCGRRGLPGIYTQVSAYLDWIDSITKQNNNNDSGNSDSDSGNNGSNGGSRPNRPPFQRPQYFPFLPPFSQFPNFPTIFGSLFPSRKSKEDEQQESSRSSVAESAQ